MTEYLNEEGSLQTYTFQDLILIKSCECATSASARYVLRKALSTCIRSEPAVCSIHGFVHQGASIELTKRVIHINPWSFLHLAKQVDSIKQTVKD